MKTPTPQQKRLSDICYQALQTKGVALNVSDCGVGKSGMGLISCAMTGRNIWVISPKITLLQWKIAAEEWGIPIQGVLNIEKVRFGNTTWARKYGKQFVLNMNPEKDILMIDEAHCVTGDSLNANLLRATKQLIKTAHGVVKYELPVLMMSATLFDSPLRLRHAVGERLSLFNSATQAQWLTNHGVILRQIPTAHGTRTFYDFPKSASRMKYLELLRSELFPTFGGALRRKDIVGFPESKIVTHVVDFPAKDLKELQSHYDALATKMMSSSETLAERTYAKQMSEFLKVHAFAEMAENLVAEGNAVIIFIYYDATMDHICSSLKLPHAVIRGGQSKQERDEAVAKFQSNQVPVCVCKISAGGVGVELGDLHGVPRVTIISPPDSALHLTQALGRPWRMNSKSATIQYIIVANNKTELAIKKNLDTKLENIDTINDGDLI